jgi:TPR repeat
MITCPLCKKVVDTPARTCPRCQADLSLLADLVTDVQRLLARAETHRKGGELAPAVEAYLAVLEIDPTNADARAALGPVVRGIRTVQRVAAVPPEAIPLRHAAITLALAGGALVFGFLLVRVFI